MLMIARRAGHKSILSSIILVCLFVCLLACLCLFDSSIEFSRLASLASLQKSVLSIQDNGVDGDGDGSTLPLPDAVVEGDAGTEHVDGDVDAVFDIVSSEEEEPVGEKPDGPEPTLPHDEDTLTKEPNQEGVPTDG